MSARRHSPRAPCWRAGAGRGGAGPGWAAVGADIRWRPPNPRPYLRSLCERANAPLWRSRGGPMRTRDAAPPDAGGCGAAAAAALPPAPKRLRAGIAVWTAAVAILGPAWAAFQTVERAPLPRERAHALAREVAHGSGGYARTDVHVLEVRCDGPGPSEHGAVEVDDERTGTLVRAADAALSAARVAGVAEASGVHARGRAATGRERAARDPLDAAATAAARAAAVASRDSDALDEARARDGAVDAAVGAVWDGAGGAAQGGHLLVLALRGCGAADAHAKAGMSGGAPTIVLGPRRAAWVHAPVEAGSDARVEAAVAAAAVALVGAAEGVEAAADGEAPAAPEPRAPPPFAHGRALTVRFVLADVHPPSSGGYEWDFARVHARALGALERALAPVGELAVRAETLRHLPAARGISEAHDDARAPATAGRAPRRRVLRRGALSPLVSALSDSLSPEAGGDAFAAELRFVLFVPDARRDCPLALEVPAGGGGGERVGGAALVRGWGGVVVHDVPRCADAREDNATRAAGGRPLSENDVAHALGAFYAQLRAHLGLPPAGAGASGGGARALARRAGAHLRALTPGAAGVAQWEALALARRRYASDVRGAVDQLRALLAAAAGGDGGGGDFVARRVPQAVADEAAAAALAVERALELARVPRTLGAARAAASEALRGAHGALMDGSLHNQQYFPLEHAVAVYVPFFAPLVAPLVVALVREARAAVVAARASGRWGRLRASGLW